MFDGEDALGQLGTMSLDNQRNLKLAIHREPVFLQVAEQVAARDERVGERLLRPRRSSPTGGRSSTSRRRSSARAGCTSTIGTSGAATARGFSASIVDLTLYVVNNHQRLRDTGASLVLYLPKIQTAEEAALWNDMLAALERHLGLPAGTDQGLRARRAARSRLPADGDPRRARAALRRLQHRPLGLHQQRVGRAGLGSVVHQPEHRRDHDDLRLHAQLRGSRAPRRQHARSARPVRALAGRHGAEHPGRLGDRASTRGMERAVAGAEREQREGASGKWVAHWKMVHIVRPGVGAGRAGQSARPRRSRRSTYTPEDAAGLMLLEPAPRTVRGARDLLSVAMQYGNAFGQGMQAAALKPADFFGNDDVLYLMEDMATGEIRLSILWEWLHKDAPLTEDDAATGVQGRRRVHGRALRAAAATRSTTSCAAPSNRDVHDDSKDTTLPIAREIVETYVPDARQAAVVHRPAEHHARRAEPGRSEAADPSVARRVPRRRPARDRESRLRCGCVSSPFAARR